jgi:hypothetical protein
MRSTDWSRFSVNLLLLVLAATRTAANPADGWPGMCCPGRVRLSCWGSLGARQSRAGRGRRGGIVRLRGRTLSRKRWLQLQKSRKPRFCDGHSRQASQ